MVILFLLTSLLLMIIVQGLITFELMKDVDYILDQLEKGKTNE